MDFREIIESMSEKILAIAEPGGSSNGLSDLRGRVSVFC
jgi:hypothetical protein